MMSGLMQRPEHFLSKRGWYDNTSGDCAFVTMIQQVVYDYQLRPNNGKQFEQRELLDIDSLRAGISLLQIGHERDSFIGLLLSDPVCSGIETIHFSYRTCKKGNAARQLIRDFIIDCD